MRRLAVILAVLAIPFCAHAQSPPNPAIPTEIAAARAEAEAMLAKFQAADLFQNATTGKVPTVRHIRSGMLCTFLSGNERNNVIVYQGLPRGDDVSCGTNISGAAFTLYATRAGGRMTATQALQATIPSLRAAHGQLKPVEGEWEEASLKDAPEVQRLRFTFQQDGVTLFSRLAIAVVGPWIIKQRMTTPLDNARNVDLMGEISILIAATSAAEANPRISP